MKQLNISVHCKIYLLLILIFGISCTDLEEETFGIVTPDSFFSNEDEAFIGLVPVYASLRPFFEERGYVGLSEVASDEIVVPARPGWGWEDGGTWIRLARHTWTSQHPDLIHFYSAAFGAVARANSFLENISKSEADFESKPQLIAEARFLRAYFYYVLLDLWGNVPIVTGPLSENDELPSNDNATNRPLVAQFVVEELKDVIDLLPEQQPGGNFGRATKGAAQMMLARMYLNANIYFETGTFSNTDLENVVSLTSEVINSGLYSLMEPYLSIFDINNELDNPEAIFVARFTNAAGASTSRNYISLNGHPSFNTTSPWGGFVVTADVVNSLDPDDDRLDQIVVGPVLDENGEPFTTVNFISGQVEPVIHDPELTDIERTGFFEGARLLKWNEDPNQVGSAAGNDFIAIRFTEAFTMRAEALLRLGDQAGALNDINIIRARSFEPDEPLAVLDLDILLGELRKEFLYEGHRRTDLIRFDKWTNHTWQFKENTDPARQLFAIPQVELDANPNLTQNPGL